MVTAVKEKTVAKKDLDPELLVRAYRNMLLARATEEKLASLYRAGMIKGGVFLGKGQEALSTASAIFLKKGDIYGPLIRDQAGRLAFGDTVLDTLRTYLGSAKGPMRGRDGNIHRGRPREGYYAMISHLGALIPVVAGGRAAPPRRNGCGRSHFHRRRRNIDRRFSRGHQYGCGGKVASGRCCRQQPIRLLHAEQPPVRLRRSSR
jgi:TPP-dependent pyruvate/acetoin dehydrogenase alpha subunit